MSIRKFFFWTHLVVGLTLGLVIMSMCISGSILAFQPQLIDFSERASRTITPPAGAQKLDNDALTQKAQDAKPDAKLSLLMVRDDPAATVMAGYGRDGVLFLNPYTGEIVGEGSHARELLHKVEEWHRWLGNRKIGKPITGAAAIAFFLLSLSGIYLWWPRKIFTTKGSGHGKNWNWHNTFGIASAFFILVITSTGITMSLREGERREAPHVRIIHQPQPKPKEFRGWIKPLHTGQAWGIPGQCINVFVAIAGLIQIWTGFALVWKRFQSSKGAS